MRAGLIYVLQVRTCPLEIQVRQTFVMLSQAAVQQLRFVCRIGAVLAE
jgi:hypothetical protein